MLIIVIGFVLIGLTVAIHSLGSSLWLTHMAKWLKNQHEKSASLFMFRAVLWTTIVLLFLHLIEVFVWAAAYYLLPERAGLESFSQAIYFSVVTFTTLGYGDVTLNDFWGPLAGFEAMVGITMFGLSTAMIFAIIQRAWGSSNNAQ